jgi:VanZ family protein
MVMMPLRLTRRAHVVGLVTSIALVVVASVVAYRDALPAVPDGGDKVLHFAMSATLAFFADGALARRSAFRGPLSPPLSSILVLLPLGIEEYLQRLSPVRTSSIWDFAADVLGVVIGTLVSRALARGDAASASSSTA